MSLDYLLGKQITSVSSPNKDKSWNWALLLEDGSKIVYTGPEQKPKNSEVEDTTIGTVYINPDGETLHLYKGTEKVSEILLPKDSYVIVWQGGEPDVVKRTDPALDLPPDPSIDRVAEGPEE